MNINTTAKRILCYGDSNTWGYIPGTAKRFDLKTRWTGILQKKLGENFEVIEEGLNSRTTVIDDLKHLDEGKNGKSYLMPCLNTHDPIDLLILFLGTNDLKERFNRTPEHIAEGIESLIKLIQSTEYDDGKSPEIIIVSPTVVDESVEGVKEKYLGAEEKSKKLGDLYKRIAEKYSFSFLDLAQHVKPSKKDGYHFDPETHLEVAELLFDIIHSK